MHLLFTTILVSLIADFSWVFADQNEQNNYMHTKNDLLLQYRNSDPPDEKVINLTANSTIYVHSSVLPRNVKFAVIQAHTQIHKVTLSQHRILEYGNHVNGSSIGIVSNVQTKRNGTSYVSGFLSNFNSFNLTVLVFFMFYNASAPVPGGCNLEFEMEVAPWFNVSYDQNVIQVDHELAAIPSNQKNTMPCETDYLRYEVFHSYLHERDFSEESFFEAIRLLRSTSDAQQYGREIRTFGFTPTTRSTFSVYPGVGRVFAVTVTYLGEMGDRYPAAAYVPAVSYGCDLSVQGSCDTLNTTLGKILCAFSLFIGIFVAFAGHRYFQVEMFLAGFTVFSVISYVVLVNKFNPGMAGLTLGTSLIGLFGGLMWWFIWSYGGIPAISVLPVFLLFGFLTASILFYLPISFEFLANDFNFWSAFGCCWLVLPALLITFTRMGNLISCGVLGSYAVVVPIDHYVGSSLKYIVVNVIRRATVHNFGRAVLDPPFQDNDLILTLVWIGLAVAGTTFQYLRERNRPPFPPPADLWRPSGFTRRTRGRQPVAERTPLITDSGVTPTVAGPHYGSVTAAVVL